MADIETLTHYVFVFSVSLSLSFLCLCVGHCHNQLSVNIWWRTSYSGDKLKRKNMSQMCTDRQTDIQIIVWIPERILKNTAVCHPNTLPHYSWPIPSFASQDYQIKVVNEWLIIILSYIWMSQDVYWGCPHNVLQCFYPILAGYTGLNHQRWYVITLSGICCWLCWNAAEI